MAISLEQPLSLLFIIPALLLLWRWNGRKRWLPRSRPWILALRGLILVLLIISLAQPHLVKTLQSQTVVFLVDASQSTQGGPDFTQWINQSLARVGPRDKAAVVAFGLDTQLLKPFAMESLPSLVNSVDQTFTNIEAALRVAYGLIPADGSGRVLLFSDGLENVGLSSDFARILAAAGIPIDVVPVAVQGSEEAAVRDIAVPRNTYPGQQIIVEVEVESTVNTRSELTVLWGGAVAFKNLVNLSMGVQRFTIPVTVSGSGLQRVRAIIAPETDTLLQNNAMDGLSFVQAPPRVLVVEGAPGKGLPLWDVLSANGVQAERIPAHQFNWSLSALASYRAVILADVPAYRLPAGQTEVLESYVKILGGGLIASGGKSSYGLGFWQDTGLERLLPVAMEVEEQEDLPGLDLVLVIDRSGSMSGEKFNMAKNAALQAVDILKERDRLAVITFDDKFYIDLPMTPITDKEQIRRVISNLTIGGGTIIYPALEKAYEMLKDSPKSKHIILLSDGVEGADFNYEGLLQRMRESGVSLTGIALGDDADGEHMEYLSALGGGRYYYVPRPQDLPAVFVQETIMAGGDYLVEEEFLPTITHGDAARVFGASPPGFRGYVASTAKPLAEVLMLTHREHPLLARWQYGLGRSVAFTSDSYGLWTREFMNHPGFASFWLDALSWVAPQLGSGGLALDVRLVDAGAEISALVSEPLAEGETLEVLLVHDDLSQQVLELKPVGQNTYTARINRAQQGVYLLSARRTQQGSTVAHGVTGFAVPYPAEFKIPLRPGTELLTALADITGGRLLENPREVFALPPGASTRAQDISHWLLLAAIILWPVDIALRRLNIGFTGTHKTRKISISPDQPAKKEVDDSLNRLLKAKSRRSKY